ncbi:ornithine cyclodeaminase [Sphingopyxis panaciterrulae]|uniref:Ornithine cyclodeaminase n=1 Tax=Sphingopyxis panaciterrulae TaxID=462372 RepID=A0A7W9B461_9SPHN|nr:ornithine cyclodeaminase [Sphingopyxis panaciterrulae]MBB5705923.1 ornithine cyclodeaminase [Sphingopyxis panaciterrulae]
MRLVEVEHVVALVADRGLETVLADLVDHIEADFRRWDEFDKSPRFASHSPGGVIELMPAADARAFGFKYVNGHPGNQAAGLQTVTGFGVLADVATGYPYLIAEMTLMTAMRTAAMSVLAARHLARPDARSMALIGLGAQSEFQAVAFHALLGIEELVVYDVDPAATDKFRRNLDARDIRVRVAASAPEATEGADIITTATADKRHATIVSANMVGAGVHLNAIGGDCPGKTELQPAILDRASVFVEYLPQTRIEGEIQQMPADFPTTELWRVIAGEAPGRRHRDEVTLFDSVGFAIEDFSTLRYLAEATAAPHLHREVDLLAQPADPRDLFGVLGRLPVANHA